ncbi:MAG: metallophosphoesterase family protein [Planctomycetota bacterium]
MRRAIISDIHANAVALEAVLEDIAEKDCDSIYCLGDVIGYGPQPRECLAHAKNLQLNLMGNHEEAVLFEPIGFNPKARVAIEWTKEQLTLPSASREENRALWDFVGSMMDRYVEDDVLYVHASPREPIREYIFVSDVRNTDKMDEIFGALDQPLCFNGHTHTAGVFTEDYQFLPPGSIGNRYKMGDKRVIINVGSVGQPRDGDPRSSYVIFDGETVEFQRVKYDVEKTIQKFRENSTLPEYLALRLIEGR